MSLLDKENARILGRRALIQWSLATGAVLGLPRWKIFEALGVAGGRALADDAACVACNRSVHVIAGDGGFAWFQLLWPHNDVAAARNDNFAWHAIGEESMAVGTDRPLTVGPETPWKSATGRRQVTALMAGTNETHTRSPGSTTTLGTGTGLFGACAAIQTANPTLVPVIAVDDVPFGGAQGAPRVARVGSADDIVSLFNSAASRAGGLLSNPRNADLFATSYSAFLSLHAAAGRPASREGFAAATTSARFLGQNLADRLRVTDEDLVRYGVTGDSRGVNRELAKGLCVTAKAFQLGLTSMVILPAFRDDPHGAFGDMANLRSTVRTMGRSFDAFMEDLDAVDDPTCAGSSMADNTVVSIHGDTAKNSLDRSGWPDGTPGNSSWTYVLGAGQLKTGWFGGIARDGTVSGWNPLTGAEVSGQTSDTTSRAAAAAITYAVARGDLRRVNDFYRGTDYRGVIGSDTV